MAWTHRDSNQAGNISSTTLVVTKPAGTVDNDLMKAIFSVVGGTIGATPSGWTALTVMTTANDECRGYWKIASSEPANYTFTGSGGTFSLQAGIATFTPPDTTTTIDVEGTITEATLDTVAGASVDPTAADSLLIFMGGSEGDDDAVMNVGSVTAGLTENIDQGNDFGNVFMHYEFLTVDTATGEKTCIYSPSQFETMSQMLIFNQAAAGAIQTPTFLQRMPIRHMLNR